MHAFDDLGRRAADRIERVTETELLHVRARIAHDLDRGRDAWPAVQWLADTSDAEAKHVVIAELDAVLAGASSQLLTADAAVDNFASDIVFGRAARDRRRVGRAFDFVSTLRASLHHPSEGAVIDDEFEEIVDRRRRVGDSVENRYDSLTRLGVQAGKGLPFWEMYMRRRRHKSWG